MKGSKRIIVVNKTALRNYSFICEWKNVNICEVIESLKIHLNWIQRKRKPNKSTFIVSN